MAAQKKSPGKKKGRRAYLSDFRQTVTGEYIYCGKTFAFQGDPQERKRLLGRLCGLGALMLAASLISGSIGVPGMLNCFYVILPYAAALISVLTLLWGLGRLIHGGDPLRQYVHDATVKAFPPRAACAMGFSLLAVLCEGVYVLLHGTGGLTTGFVLFLIFHGVIFGAAFLWLRLIIRVKWSGGDAPQ